MSKGILKVKPECLIPGLHIMVDWHGDQTVMFKGVVIKKLRKNWLVEVTNQFGDVKKCSVPHDQITNDVAYTKNGKQLMATEEDEKYLFSKEHIDYHRSLLVADQDFNKKVWRSENV